MAKLDSPFTSDSAVIELVELFESCCLNYDRWTHRAHLAVAVVYGQRYPHSEVLDRVRLAIRRYNESRGDFMGYHETITRLFVQIVADEIRHSTAGLAELVNTIDDRWPMSRLHEHYTVERLWSPVARTNWIEPDLQPLEFAGEQTWHVGT